MVKSMENLKVKGIDLLSPCKKRVGDAPGSVFGRIFGLGILLLNKIFLGFILWNCINKLS